MPDTADLIVLSLHSYEDPYILPTTLFQILSNLPIFPVISNPHPNALSLAEWVMKPHLICYFNQWYYGSTHVEPWYLSMRKTLMCASCNKASSLLRPGTKWGFLLALWFDITHTQRHTHKHTQHTQGPVDLQAHVNIYLHHRYMLRAAIFITLNK